MKLRVSGDGVAVPQIELPVANAAMQECHRATSTPRAEWDAVGGTFCLVELVQLHDLGPPTWTRTDHWC